MLLVDRELTARRFATSGVVGVGIVPASALSRIYRDVLGRVNRVVASQADRVYLMVAGLFLDLKTMGAARHIDAVPKDEGLSWTVLQQ